MFNHALILSQFLQKLNDFIVKNLEFDQKTLNCFCIIFNSFIKRYVFITVKHHHINNIIIAILMFYNMSKSLSKLKNYKNKKIRKLIRLLQETNILIK